MFHSVENSGVSVTQILREINLKMSKILKNSKWQI